MENHRGKDVPGNRSDENVGTTLASTTQCVHSWMLAVDVLVRSRGSVTMIPLPCTSTQMALPGMCREDRNMLDGDSQQ